MPNWCMNTMTLQHDDPAALERVKTALEGEGIGKEFCPPPVEDEWYSWNVENLGTKWDFTSSDDATITENTLTANFDTAWAPPIALMRLLENLGYRAELNYWEPGMGFVGRYSTEDGDDYYDNQNEAPDDIRDYWGIDEIYDDEWEDALEEIKAEAGVADVEMVDKLFDDEA